MSIDQRTRIDQDILQDMEEIFELEDSTSSSTTASTIISPSSSFTADSISNPSQPSTPIQQSPLLSASYYKYHHYQLDEGEDDLSSNYDYLLYECFICKQRLEGNHNCTMYSLHRSSSSSSTTSIVNDQQIEKNNQLITSNYRKWLFDLTPKLPY